MFNCRRHFPSLSQDAVARHQECSIEHRGSRVSAVFVAEAASRSLQAWTGTRPCPENMPAPVTCAGNTQGRPRAGRRDERVGQCTPNDSSGARNVGDRNGLHRLWLTRSLSSTLRWVLSIAEFPPSILLHWVLPRQEQSSHRAGACLALWPLLAYPAGIVAVPLLVAVPSSSLCSSVHVGHWRFGALHPFASSEARLTTPPEYLGNGPLYGEIIYTDHTFFFF